MTRPHATALLAAALASFVLAPTAAAQADSQIKIGLIGPFTGGSADFGNSMRNGVELAVSEINALGGYVGRKFERVVRDEPHGYWFCPARWTLFQRRASGVSDR